MRARWFDALSILLLPGALAACAFDASGIGDDVAPPDGFVDPGDDGGGVPRTWRDDAVDDFAVDGAVLDHALVEPWGAIGPAAYMTGGLVVRTSNDELFSELSGDEWDALVAATPAGMAPWSLGRRDGRPRGVGIDADTSFTAWWEGELWLDAGTHTFALTADDRGFVELAAPGTTTFTRVVAATYDADGTGELVAPVDGWYPIRVAWAQGIGLAYLEVQVSDAGAKGTAPIAAERLRFRADGADVTGLVWTAFDDSKLLAPHDTYLFRRAAFDYRPSNGEVTGLGLSEADRFSMRWTGQVRIDVAGDYTFRLDTDDGHRLWLDGALVLDHFTDDPQDHTTAPIGLDAGWHDLVVDFTDNTGNQEVRMRVEAGPELEGAELPADRLRPVAPRRERVLGGRDDAIQVLPDGGDAAAYAYEIGAPAGAVATAIEVGVIGSHQRWEDVEVVVVPPGGAPVVVAAAGALAGNGNRTWRLTTAIPGAPAAPGEWSVQLRDTVGGDTGTINQVAATVRYTCGAPPIATVAVYESPVEDLGAIVGFDAATWTGRVRDGATVAVRFRSCDAADACAEEAWSEPITTSGDKPPVLARRFAQYRVELGSDGDVTPSVDAIEIAYRSAD